MSTDELLKFVVPQTFVVTLTSGRELLAPLAVGAIADIFREVKAEFWLLERGVLRRRANKEDKGWLGISLPVLGRQINNKIEHRRGFIFEHEPQPCLLERKAFKDSFRSACRIFTVTGVGLGHICFRGRPRLRFLRWFCIAGAALV